MVGERRRLNGLALQAFSDLVSHYEISEAYERGIPVAERLLVIDPLQEQAHGALIRLYWRSGRRAAALRQYQECARILDRELGVVPGKAIQKLVAEIGREPVADDSLPSPGKPAPAVSDDAPPPAPTPLQEPPATLPAERKQLTVLCARIRELADGSDPEAALARVDPVLEVMVESVGRFGGTVSQVRDDGVTALFGAPRAHEDHAVRACYAALEMRDGIPALVGQPLDVRVGLHSGEAVVRTIGDEQSGHYDAVGPVGQVASRIDGALEPGQIGMSAETRRRAEGFVELEALGKRSLEGVASLVDLYSLEARSELRLRWEARSARELTSFVGRDDEMDRLVELLQRVAGGSGQVVTIVGEPGIGKSRLVHELVCSSAVDGCTVLEVGTRSHETSATYLPIAGLLRAWFAIGERDSRSQAAEKVRAGVSSIDPAFEPLLPPLFALLGIPVEDPRWPVESALQKRQRTLEAIKAIVVRQSQTQPVVLVVEDLHWIDGDSQVVLDHLVEGVGAARVLLLFTHRPEYRHEWLGKTYFSQLSLNALVGEEADRLVRALLGDDPSLEPLHAQLVERGEGTPLFLEESVRALVETGALVGTQGAYRLTRPVESFRIPSSVQAVLAERIDRLPVRAKSLLQAASVIGKDVPVELLQPIIDLDQPSLDEILIELEGAEFLYQTRLMPLPEYTFKHALTHQVAYESVLKERRRAVHVQLVELLEGFPADRQDEHVEILAHHCVGGELWVKALGYLHASATKAIQRSAHQQAIQYLKRGLALMDRLPDSRERLQTELDYQKAMGVTMMAARGWAASEVLDAYTRAKEISEQLDDERELFIALRGQGQYHMIRGESQAARERGDACVGLAGNLDEVGVHIETHHLFWTNSFLMGDYANAELHSGKGMALYERERDHELTYLYSGHDPGVCCRSFHALIECLYGYADKALVRCREALDLAEQLEHPLTTALALWALSYAHLFRREPQAARQWAEREIAVCDEYLLPLLHSQGMFQLGWALTELGEPENGIVHMREGLAAISATGAEMGLPYFEALLGEALARAGRPDEGLQTIEQAISRADRHGTHFQFPEMLRMKGELLLMLSSANEAEARACFTGAMEAAEGQGAHLPRLRAAVSLARLLESRGDPAAGLAVLRPPFNVIEEGLDTPALEEAAVLIQALENA
jgi:class 3 adenylate cyclase/predicted ATPase